jgi:hypothetical protein
VKVRKHVPFHEDEATEQAGWLFADSFLALMIIFLATISFVPDIQNVDDAVNNYTKALTLNYAEYSADNIELDISNFIKNEGLAASSEVVFARLIGGAPEIQNEDNGYLLALKFSLNVQKDLPTYFSNTRFDMGASNLIQNKTVLLQLTFAPRGL